MTNTVTILTILSTNWLPMTLAVPNGDGTTSKNIHEIGIVVSNRYARVVADGTTNQILLSSQAMAPKSFLIRPQESQFCPTNAYIIPFSQWIHFTNAPAHK